MTTRRKAVGVRLTARLRAELQRTAKRHKTTVSALVRDRLHAAGAPDVLLVQRGRTSHLSMRVNPATYAWAVEGAAAAGVSVSAFLGDVAARRNARPRR